MGSKLGSIVKLYATKENDSTRIMYQSLRLNKGGILNDKFFQKNTKREVLITSTKSYDFASSINLPLQESDLGENILVDFDIKELHIGDTLQIGDTQIKISMECPICNHLSKIDKTFPKLIKDERGIFGEVIQGGKIHQGDTIYKI